MHINPSMSGPVYLRRKTKAMSPRAVAFAGAEFVVVGKSVVGVQEVWDVISEVRHVQDRSCCPHALPCFPSLVRNAPVDGVDFSFAIVERQTGPPSCPAVGTSGRVAGALLLKLLFTDEPQCFLLHPFIPSFPSFLSLPPCSSSRPLKWKKAKKTKKTKKTKRSLNLW